MNHNLWHITRCPLKVDVQHPSSLGLPYPDQKLTTISQFDVSGGKDQIKFSAFLCTVPVNIHILFLTGTRNVLYIYERTFLIFVIFFYACAHRIRISYKWPRFFFRHFGIKRRSLYRKFNLYAFFRQRFSSLCPGRTRFATLIWWTRYNVWRRTETNPNTLSSGFHTFFWRTVFPCNCDVAREVGNQTFAVLNANWFKVVEPN